MVSAADCCSSSFYDSSNAVGTTLPMSTAPPTANNGRRFLTETEDVYKSCENMIPPLTTNPVTTPEIIAANQEEEDEDDDDENDSLFLYRISWKPRQSQGPGYKSSTAMTSTTTSGNSRRDSLYS